MTSAPVPLAVPPRRRPRVGFRAVTSVFSVFLIFFAATRPSFSRGTREGIFTIPHYFAQAAPPRAPPAAASSDRCQPARALPDRRARAPSGAAASALPDPLLVTTDGFPRARRAVPPSRAAYAGTPRARAPWRPRSRPPAPPSLRPARSRPVGPAARSPAPSAPSPPTTPPPPPARVPETGRAA